MTAVTSRIFISRTANKNNKKNLILFAHYYVIATLAIGLDFAFISFVYYDLKNDELRFLITIVNVGLLTAAIGTLAVWLRAYLAFTIPQLIALTSVFILNDTIFIAVVIIVYSWFILTVAKNFNENFIEGRMLLQKNIQLIADMEYEIKGRQIAQDELEAQQKTLEKMVQDRTLELENKNDALKEQIKINVSVEKELEYRAYYDELTKLPNRSLFIQHLKQSLSQAQRNDSLLAVIFVDLDRFKKINDSHGHFIGDKVLKNVSTRLQKILRTSDKVARNGGDEFVILLENMKDVREPYVVANKIIDIIQE